MFRRENVLVLCSQSKKEWTIEEFEKTCSREGMNMLGRKEGLDRARHRQLEDENDRKMISKIGKGRNGERTRKDWGRRNRKHENGGNKGG
jgi:hypothetical protein